MWRPDKHAFESCGAYIGPTKTVATLMPARDAASDHLHSSTHTPPMRAAHEAIDGALERCSALDVYIHKPGPAHTRAHATCPSDSA